MKNFTAVETLGYIIELFISYLESFAEETDPAKEQFISGERIAYIECLEIIQKWEFARKYGLDFNIEERFRV